MMQSNKYYIVGTTVLLLLMLAVPSFIQAGPPMKSHGARIRLGVTQFAPSQGERPTIPPGLAIKGYPAGKRGYYIVQFSGPIQQNWKEQVTATGAEILDYIPDFAFKVRMNTTEAHQVEELESVTWVGFYHPAYKLSPDLKRNGTHMYTVRIERSADVAAARAAIVQSGARVLDHKGGTLKVAADSAQLEAIARVLDVAWVQNFMMWEKHNEWGGGIIMGGSAAESNGYDGTDQIIAIADTGLGGGTEDTAHLDLPQGRIMAIHNWTRAHPPTCVDLFCICYEEILDNGAQDPDSGHGTHTTLSALGEGGPSNEGRGTAPGAHLIFQAVEDYVNYYPYDDPTDTYFCEWLYDVKAGYYLSGIPSNIAALFQQAYNEGARIHSDSWGSNAMGVYTLDSRNADQFIWDHADMTITYSAGNSGTDGNGDGVIDSDSIGSPATAKNVITVGASENERGDPDPYPCDDVALADCQGNNEPLPTYGQAWPVDYPVNPIKDDPTGGNAEQMAAFSSRGPTNDGRIKPDLVAPGTWVLSGYSDMYQQGYDPSTNPQNRAWQYDGWGLPYNSFYKYMGGTSMSSPLVAGGAAVVREFYQRQNHNASAALVKATLINSAHDLLDENNDNAVDTGGALVNNFPVPNVHEGWGRVDLANATDGSHQFEDESSGINPPEVVSLIYHYAVEAGGAPFKVTLVWSDYPSATGVSKNLVNDLDLRVTSPQGTAYKGNVFSGGWSVAGGTEDRLNNVENVYVQSPAAGTWTVEVKGFNLPYPPQPFALVVDGTFVQVDTPPSVSIVDPQEGQTLSGTYRVLVNASDDVQVDSVALSIDGGAYIDISSNVDQTTKNYFYDWQTPEGENNVLHTLQARATDNADPINYSYSDVVNITVDNVNDPPANHPPIASFTYTCTGLTCEFSGSGIDSDGTIVGYAWDFGDGNSGSGMSPSNEYAVAGTYTVQLTVTDNDGDTGTDSQDITVSAPPDTMHLEALSVKTKAGRWFWSMKVTATVQDANNGPVANARLRYFWSDTPGSIYDDCVTNQSGECSVVGYQFRGTCLTFTVVDVLHNTLTYDPDQNIATDISACK